MRNTSSAPVKFVSAKLVDPNSAMHVLGYHMISLHDSDGAQVTGGVIHDPQPLFDYSRYKDYYARGITIPPHRDSPYYVVVYFRDPSKKPARVSTCEISYESQGKLWRQRSQCHFKATRETPGTRASQRE